MLYEDATEIALVGFSYGGMVVTGALAHIADRVREPCTWMLLCLPTGRR